MQSSINKKILLAVIFLFISVGIFAFSLILSGASKAGATAPAGLNAQVATTSTVSVGPLNNVYALGTTTNESRYQCAARIISTAGQPIMISFASLSSTTLSQVVGFQQVASTTVAYDGGLYGCGYMTIRGMTASTTITIGETH